MCVFNCIFVVQKLKIKATEFDAKFANLSAHNDNNKEIMAPNWLDI